MFFSGLSINVISRIIISINRCCCSFIIIVIVVAVQSRIDTGLFSPAKDVLRYYFIATRAKHWSDKQELTNEGKPITAVPVHI